MHTEHVDILHSPDGFGFGIRFGIERDGVTHVAIPGQMKPHIPGDIIPTVLNFGSNGAQGLMDQLWDLGFRPRNLREHTSQELMQAKNDHLHDLRVLMGERCAVKLV